MLTCSQFSGFLLNQTPDDILKILVKPMKAGVNVTVLADACHSGTVMDLPYRFSADDSKMRLDQGMNMDNFLNQLGGAQAVVCCALLACLVMDLISDLDG